MEPSRLSADELHELFESLRRIEDLSNACASSHRDPTDQPSLGAMTDTQPPTTEPVNQYSPSNDPPQEPSLSELNQLSVSSPEDGTIENLTQLTNDNNSSPHARESVAPSTTDNLGKHIFKYDILL